MGTNFKMSMIFISINIKNSVFEIYRYAGWIELEKKNMSQGKSTLNQQPTKTSKPYIFFRQINNFITKSNNFVIYVKKNFPTTRKRQTDG